jgi:hypothetical protein
MVDGRAAVCRSVQTHHVGRIFTYFPHWSNTGRSEFRAQRDNESDNIEESRWSWGRASALTFCFTWLPIVDTYRTLCIAPSPEVRAVFQAIRNVGTSFEAQKIFRSN